MSTPTRRRVAVSVVTAAAVVAVGCAGEKKGATDTTAAATATGAAATDTTRGGAAAGATAGPAGGGAFAHASTISGFKTPESVLYDPDQDVYFVSNIDGNASQKDNNGFIARVKPDGTVDSLRFIAGGRGGVTLNAPKGSVIVGDTIWVADIDAVRGFNRRTGAPVASIELGRFKAHFLNDIAVGADGAMYVTDTGVIFGPTGKVSHPGPDQIIRIAGRTPTVAASDSAFAGPNGIAWDRANGRFVIASFTGKSVETWKPGEAKPGTLADGVGQFDGIGVLGDGRVLVSSWADSAITAFGGGTAGAASGAKVVTGVPGPADFGVDTKRNRVLVPILQGDRVEIFDIK